MITTSRFVLSVWLLSVFSVCSQAAGPVKVATMDRQLWPENIQSPEAFDRGSLAEIMRFASIMANIDFGSVTKVQAFTGLKTVNMDSLQHWQERTQIRLLHAYQQASHSKRILSWAALLETANARLPEYSQKWFAASGAFYSNYLYEQVRLAALFPRISSEIDIFSANELTGNHYHDGEFLLTYDDGPHPTRTHTLISNLNSKGIKASFFVMGSKLNQHKQQGWYQTQCLGSHGWQHKSHTKLAWAKDSITQTEAAIQALQATDQPIPFRPPYGARSKDVARYLAQRNIPVYLWNIDSQDWNTKLSLKQVTDRVVTLMLLWRKGIILFHDIHNKANDALDELDYLVKNSGKQWRSCRSTKKLDQHFINIKEQK